MFDIGWPELFVIAAVALIVVGPKELPGLLRGLGDALGKMRRMAADFRQQFNQALDDAELSAIKDGMETIQNATNPMTMLSADVQKSTKKMQEKREALAQEMNDDIVNDPEFDGDDEEDDPGQVELHQTYSASVDTTALETPALDEPASPNQSKSGAKHKKSAKAKPSTKAKSSPKAKSQLKSKPKTPAQTKSKKD